MAARLLFTVAVPSENGRMGEREGGMGGRKKGGAGAGALLRTYEVFGLHDGNRVPKSAIVEA